MTKSVDNPPVFAQRLFAPRLFAPRLFAPRLFAQRRLRPFARAQAGAE
jgi:hypothetical protein